MLVDSNLSRAAGTGRANPLRKLRVHTCCLRRPNSLFSEHTPCIFMWETLGAQRRTQKERESKTVKDSRAGCATNATNALTRETVEKKAERARIGEKETRLESRLHSFSLRVASTLFLSRTSRHRPASTSRAFPRQLASCPFRVSQAGRARHLVRQRARTCSHTTGVRLEC